MPDGLHIVSGSNPSCSLGQKQLLRTVDPQLLMSWGVCTQGNYPKPIFQGLATSSGGGKLCEVLQMVAQVSAKN